MRRPRALHKTLVNTDLQLGRNSNNYATLRTCLFLPLLTAAFSKSCLLKSKPHCLKHREKKYTDPAIHNIFHKYFMNPFTRLKPVWQKKKTLSPILVPACQHITGEWVSHVTSSLRDCEGQARRTQIGGRTEKRTEGKVKGRWKGGGGEGGGRGVITSSPHVFIFFPYYLWPPLTPVTQSHKP